MTALVVAADHVLLVARCAAVWSVDAYLQHRAPRCVAVDPGPPPRVYCGTSGHGLWIGGSAGRAWAPAGPGVRHATITAVAARGATPGRLGPAYAGTEPSAVFRSDDGGAAWTESVGLGALASARTWSFPPRPETHHVRWIEPDPTVAGRVFVAIEAGALVRTPDGGRTWIDRTPDGPYDTHTAATHPLAPGRVYAAAGDGYFQSADAGASWTRVLDGLRHRYLVSVAVDPADPDVVVVSAAAGPAAAYRPRGAETHVYRMALPSPWVPVTAGLPPAAGTTVCHFATWLGEPGVIYAANNRGAFRSADAGRSWNALAIPWPAGTLERGVHALACLPA